MHVDTDEANAFNSDTEPYGVIVGLLTVITTDMDRRRTVRDTQIKSTYSG
ncbi:MAG: hypothetical protein ACLUUZ_14040 [Blautia wexlerae]